MPEIVEETLLERFRLLDPGAYLINSGHHNGKIDLTVVSTLFEGMDSSDREGLVWPMLRDLPEQDLLRMTYCLFLTPEEAAQHFGQLTTEETPSA